MKQIFELPPNKNDGAYGDMFANIQREMFRLCRLPSSLIRKESSVIVKISKDEDGFALTIESVQTSGFGRSIGEALISLGEAFCIQQEFLLKSDNLSDGAEGAKRALEKLISAEWP